MIPIPPTADPASPNHTAGPPPTPPVAPAPRHRLGTVLWRYMVSERYADMVVHGLFHFCVVMLAFIVGNVWAGREAEMRDLRGQHAVLIPLRADLDQLHTSAANAANPAKATPGFPAPPPNTNRQGAPAPAARHTRRDAPAATTATPATSTSGSAAPAPKESSEAAPSPPGLSCQVGFAAATTPPLTRWDSMTPTDRYFLLADQTFYNALFEHYESLREWPSSAKQATSVENCKTYWTSFASELSKTVNQIDTRIGTVKRQYEGFQRWWSASTRRIALWVLLGFVIVVALPLLLRAFEHTLLRARQSPRRLRTEETPADTPTATDAPR